MEPTHPVSHWFKKDEYYRTCHPRDTLTKYIRLVSKYIAKTEKQMTVRIKDGTFESFNAILAIRFLKSFPLACNKNGVHKGAAVRLFHFFKIYTASAVINARLSAERTEKIKGGLAGGKRGTLLSTHKLPTFYWRSMRPMRLLQKQNQR